MTEQNQKTTEGNGTDGNSYKKHGNNREQAGMSQESRRTMEKALENTVHDNSTQRIRTSSKFIGNKLEHEMGHF